MLDPSRLAVGVGDNMIRIWDTGAHGSSHGVTNLWRGIGTKVMKVKLSIECSVYRMYEFKCFNIWRLI